MQIILLKTTPEEAFWHIKDHRQAFWLDSGRGDTERSRYSILGAEPVCTFIIDAKGKSSFIAHKVKCNSDKGLDNPTIDSQVGAQLLNGDYPLEALSALLKYRSAQFDAALKRWDHKCEAAPSLPFISGGVGYLSYEARHLVEKLPSKAINDAEIPWGRFDFYNWCYVYDHVCAQGYLVSPFEEEDLSEWREILSGIAEIEVSSGPFIASEPVSNMNQATYTQAIDAIKGYIASGDIYQINMTQRFSADAIGDPLSLYYQLRAINPAPFGAYLRYPDFQVLCSSPERFIKVDSGIIETRPIKGTVPRTANPAKDLENINWLQSSAKDRSELLMIVDLERNDLSKVAAKGTVQVPELFVIESYPTVHHLVSTVTAKLAHHTDLVDVIRATFPGGSITGTPKIRAMEIIDCLEPTARNLYTGAIGYLSDSGNLDLNIVIRTIVYQNDKYYYQVGGGIVWDSQTQSEYEECFHKAKALVNALKGQGVQWEQSP